MTEHTQVFEDILPLAPLQQGLLFHALYDNDSPDIYISQRVLAIDGAVDRHQLTVALSSLDVMPIFAPASLWMACASQSRSFRAICHSTSSSWICESCR